MEPLQSSSLLNRIEHFSFKMGQSLYGAISKVMKIDSERERVANSQSSETLDEIIAKDRGNVPPLVVRKPRRTNYSVLYAVAFVCVLLLPKVEAASQMLELCMDARRRLAENIPTKADQTPDYPPAELTNVEKQEIADFLLGKTGAEIEGDTSFVTSKANAIIDIISKNDKKIDLDELTKFLKGVYEETKQETINARFKLFAGEETDADISAEELIANMTDTQQQKELVDFLLGKNDIEGDATLLSQKANWIISSVSKEGNEITRKEFTEFIQKVYEDLNKKATATIVAPTKATINARFDKFDIIHGDTEVISAQELMAEMTDTELTPEIAAKFLLGDREIDFFVDTAFNLTIKGKQLVKLVEGKNGNNEITRDGFSKFIKKVYKNTLDETITARFDLFDVSNSKVKKISWGELKLKMVDTRKQEDFVAFLLGVEGGEIELPGKSLHGRAVKILKYVEGNDSNSEMSEAEFEKFIMNIKPNTAPGTITERFQTFDSNKDNKVSVEELVAEMKNTDFPIWAIIVIVVLCICCGGLMYAAAQ